MNLKTDALNSESASDDPLAVRKEVQPWVIPSAIRRRAFVTSLNHEALPPSVVDKMKASLLHALIIPIVGARTSHGSAAIALVKG